MNKSSIEAQIFGVRERANAQLQQIESSNQCRDQKEIAIVKVVMNTNKAIENLRAVL